MKTKIHYCCKFSKPETSYHYTIFMGSGMTIRCNKCHRVNSYYYKYLGEDYIEKAKQLWNKQIDNKWIEEIVLFVEDLMYNKR